MRETVNPFSLSNLNYGTVLWDQRVFNVKQLFCISPIIIPPCGGGHHSYIIKCSFLWLTLSFKADCTLTSGPILSLLSLLWCGCQLSSSCLCCPVMPEDYFWMQRTRRRTLWTGGDTAGSTQVGAAGWSQRFKYSLWTKTGPPKSSRKRFCKPRLWKIKVL